MFTTAEEYKKVLVKTVSEYDALLAHMQNYPLIAMDTETTGLNTMTAKLMGMSFYFGTGTGYYVIGDVVKTRTRELEALMKRIVFAYHNAKYENQICHFELGIQTLVPGMFCDTIVLDHILDPDEGHKLKECLRRYFNWDVKDYDELFDGEPLEHVPPERVYEYGCVDAIGTYELLLYHLPKLEEFSTIVELDTAVIPVISDMEMLGIRMDTKFLNAYKAPLLKQIEILKQEVFSIAGGEFDIASAAQIGEILFGRLQLPPPGLTKTGKWQTGALVLEQLAANHPIASKILEYRELVKMEHDYVSKIVGLLGPDNICRASYNQTVVPTGRLASSCGKLTGGACNIQQIPKRGKVLISDSMLTEEEVANFKSVGAKVEENPATGTFKVELVVKPRKGFIPREGRYLISADYKAIEFRIMVLLSNERTIIDEILNGIDVHVSTACTVFGVTAESVTPEMRDTAKMLNYAVLYGMDYHGLMTRLRITEDEAKLLYARFMTRIPKTVEWIKDVQIFAMKNGYIKTFFGRRRFIKDLIKCKDETDPKLRRKMISKGLRGAVNSVVQGSAADIMRMAMVRVNNAFSTNFSTKVDLLASLHDQILAEADNDVPVNEALRVVKEAMEFPVTGWDLPLEVEFELGPSWGEPKKAFYEVAGRNELVITLPSSIAQSKLVQFKHSLKKLKGTKPIVVVTAEGQSIVCKEQVPASDEVVLAVRGILGPEVGITWR